LHGTFREGKGIQLHEHLARSGLLALRAFAGAMIVMRVRPCDVPMQTHLSSYKDGLGYADCYVVEMPGEVTQAAFIEAFYTSPLFKIERVILGLVASKPATDADARQLALGKATSFSAWRVEAQSASELLLADITGRTRSWLMAKPNMSFTGLPSTLLYFGSAVVPLASNGSKGARMGKLFVALSGFHRLYSRLLLSAASSRVRAVSQA